jgi:hypothetical protein
MGLCIISCCLQQQQLLCARQACRMGVSVICQGTGALWVVGRGAARGC